MADPKPRSETVLRSALSASTDADRLTWPIRIAAIFPGLLCATIGFGGVALLIDVVRNGKFDFALIPGFPLLAAMGLYGSDLILRGVTGRPVGRRLWRRVESWILHGRSARAGWMVLAFLLASGLIAWFRMRHPADLDGVMILAAAGLHIFTHEAGHLVTARAVGYRPRWLTAGPLVIRVEGSRLRFALNRSWQQLFGGLAAYEPIRQTRKRDLAVAAAGPLTNLGLAGAALEIWGWPVASSVSGVFLRNFIGVGLAVAVINLIPFPRTAQGFALDGREILDRLRGRPAPGSAAGLGS